MDDFDNFIRHSQFGHILEIAVTLKHQKARLAALARGEQDPRNAAASSLSMRPRKKKNHGLDESRTGTAFRHGQDIEHPQSRLGITTQGVDVLPRNVHLPSVLPPPAPTPSFDGAAGLIRAALISPATQGSDSTGVSMARGECLITDSLVDDTINSLVDELKLCMDLKKKLRMSRQRQGSRLSEGRHSGEDQGMNWTEVGTRVKTEKNGGKEGEDADEKSIAYKFSKWQTDIMTDWMIEHREHPYPTHEQVGSLASATNLNFTQVVNWTTNIRKRNRKATIDGKKPHHFLDYLFLATDREKRHPDVDFSSFGGTLGKAKQAGEAASYAPLITGTPHIRHQSHQRPIHRHRRTAVPPRAPRNTGHIFRRGKCLGNLKQGRSKQPPSLAQNDAQLQQLRERERRVLAEYAPRGIDTTPPGCFDGNSDTLTHSPFDQSMFEEAEATNQNWLHAGASGDKDSKGRQSKAVSFEMDDMPFDESAEDYLMRLIQGT